MSKAVAKNVAGLGPPSILRAFPRCKLGQIRLAPPNNSNSTTILEIKKRLFGRFFISIVAGLGVEPSLWDYEPQVHRTLSRDFNKTQQQGCYCNKAIREKQAKHP